MLAPPSGATRRSRSNAPTRPRGGGFPPASMSTPRSSGALPGRATCSGILTLSLRGRSRRPSPLQEAAPAFSTGGHRSHDRRLGPDSSRPRRVPTWPSAGRAAPVTAHAASARTPARRSCAALLQDRRAGRSRQRPAAAMPASARNCAWAGSTTRAAATRSRSGPTPGSPLAQRSHQRACAMAGMAASAPRLLAGTGFPTRSAGRTLLWLRRRSALKAGLYSSPRDLGRAEGGARPAEISASADLATATAARQRTRRRLRFDFPGRSAGDGPPPGAGKRLAAELLVSAGIRHGRGRPRRQLGVIARRLGQRQTRAWLGAGSRGRAFQGEDGRPVRPGSEAGTCAR